MSAVELEQPMDINAFCSCSTSFHLMSEQHKSVVCLPFSPQLQEPSDFALAFLLCHLVVSWTKV